ncbi:Alpha/Beta hydrolase protein [Exophiala viscosa]|uniref:Alpha/Beta hydrolase protein n=1 Tax=Exophiala viscosa TaxID=2486360 RepID=A0AAN6E731_9EURO|nr:Alpha/Beta hydrolase protein [Exophiala viscosa]
MRRTINLLSLLAGLSNARPQVSAPAGIFHGNSSIAHIDQFVGIPYAKPPVGDLRFANPEAPVTSSSNVVKATAYGPGCSQLDIYAEYNGLSEDCLSLNVIRPTNISATASLPVLFWIHGGGNVNGQSIFYNGTAIVQHSITIDQPVIYVGINYRLGGFGFLGGPAVLSAGVSNLGLKDQYLALEWAHTNIKSFGGDPTKVTIFGESAESGAPGAPGFEIALTAAAGASQYDDLLNSTNCTTLSCLITVPYDIISPILVTFPEGAYLIDNDCLNDTLTNLVEKNSFSHIPIIHGTNLNEGAVFMPDPFNYPNRTALIDTVAGYLNNETSFATLIVDAYNATDDTDLGKGYDADPTADHGFFVACGLYTDMDMDLGKLTLLKIASENANVWGYDFRQRPALSAMNLSYEYPGVSTAYTEGVGVFHGAELPYVFGEATNLPDRSPGDDEVAIKVLNAWISFAYYLNPNNPEKKNTVTWPKYNSTSPFGEVIIFEQQGNLSIRAAPNTFRAVPWDIWGFAEMEIGQHPPY